MHAAPTHTIPVRKQLTSPGAVGSQSCSPGPALLLPSCPSPAPRPCHSLSTRQGLLLGDRDAAGGVHFLSAVGVGRPGQGGPRNTTWRAQGHRYLQGLRWDSSVARLLPTERSPPRSGGPFTPTLMRFLGVFVSSVECTHAFPYVHPHFYTHITTLTSTGSPTHTYLHTPLHSHTPTHTLSHAYSYTHVPLYIHPCTHLQDSPTNTATHTYPYTHTPAYTSKYAHLRSHTSSIRARLHATHTDTSTPTRTFTHTQSFSSRNIY